MSQVINSILASGIPTDVPRTKIQEFFSFCGKIDRIEDYSLSKSDTEQVVHVFFASPAAVSTALLLNGAELGGKPVTVLEFNDGVIPTTVDTSSVKGGEIAEKQDALAPAPGAPEGAHVGSTIASVPGDDIEQEHKPKSAIFAEYLAHGYVLSDQLTKKAVEYDAKNGYTDKFKKFVADLDEKYKLQDKQKKVDEKYNITGTLGKYFDHSQQYVEKAKQTGLGSRLHKFYKGVASDATQIHEEAKRLADLKKQQGQSETTASAGANTAAEAVPEKQ